MTELAAIRAAIGLLHLPSSVRHVRLEPLPAGIEDLLRVASGDSGVLTEMAERTERSEAVVQSAAIFYIEQILLSPESDCYRVLGATALTPAAEIRRNMALLMSWLHPDKNLSGERAVYAARVTQAWDTLRNPDRKTAYDATLEAAQDASPRHAQSNGGVRPGGDARGVAFGPSGRGERPLPLAGFVQAPGENFIRRALRYFQSRSRP